MKMAKAMMLVGCICLVMCGCTPTPKKTKVEDAQGIVDVIKYVKAKNGLCYGVATVERVSSSGSLAVNNMLVYVKCGDVGL